MDMSLSSEFVFATAAKITILDDVVPSFESELAQDVITIIAVFSAKLYGSRSHQNKIKKLSPGHVCADKVS